ncbi:hypothetical protein PVL29_015242 [Vitis rotundifolia]|uniref:FAS1 domain-containing protein n=1 Tax=Vitis rotundifolia TaxID=103349 RepID=A0AA39DIM5_VITRO|nr:hypothetical protein PVL29_015242 [Vitis rotundifolia]
MASTSLSLILLALSTFLLVLSPYAQAQKPSAPAPSPSHLNLTGILDKNGQFKTFIRLLATTQIGDQIKNQLKSSTEGMTVFAPTDNAFSNLKPGTLNALSDQEQVQLILYHVLSKFYSLDTLLTVSNPVRTQATGQDGGIFGLNFTGEGNQVNVSTGIIETQINNVLRGESPLAVYQVDKVLLPLELFGAKPPALPPPPAKAPSSAKNATAIAEEPSASASEKSDHSGSGGRNVGFGLAVGLGLMCMGALW